MFQGAADVTRAAETLAQATATLAQAGIEGAGRDARLLLAHAIGVPSGRLTLFLSEPMSDTQQARYETLIAQRALRAPVSHLIGRRMFYGRDFLVTPEVLDPRPETETLIEAALAEPFASVLDLGTGSGCILLTLLAERETAIGLGVELSKAALNVAFWNRNALKLEQRAALEQGSWYAPLVDLAERFDLIVANPPYIAASEMDALAPEVRDHEPRMALTDEADGLSAYRLICQGARRHLAISGRLMVEIGPTQALAVTAIMSGAGLSRIQVIRDLDGRDRVVLGRVSPV